MQQGIQSPAEQVAQSLLEDLRRSRWSGMMPGIHKLVAELGFPRKAIEQALLMLEKQGFLVPQGVGKRRKIIMPKDMKAPALKVRILHYQDIDLTLNTPAPTHGSGAQRDICPFEPVGSGAGRQTGGTDG